MHLLRSSNADANGAVTAMRVLYLEPFDGGSHAAFTRTLTGGVEAEWTVATLPGRHWKWRMRGSAVYLAQRHGEAIARGHDVVLASSYVPLAELVGICRPLQSVSRILYFHENQLAYPVREGFSGERDDHFGFTQLVSGLAANRCVFNSAHNRDSFLVHADALLRRMPDAVPAGWVETIERRSQVLGLPLDLWDADSYTDLPMGQRAHGPLIVWNHRWEHDKRPDLFFDALARLVERGVPFRVAVCGQSFRQVPGSFTPARERLGDHVVQWGYLAAQADYRALLGRAQIAVSTADHEFFGISMIEAAHAGAHPLVPDRLSYPELFAPDYRYGDGELASRLEDLCRRWTGGEVDLRQD